MLNFQKALAEGRAKDDLGEEEKKAVKIYCANDILFLQELTPELGKAISLLWSNQKVKDFYTSDSSVQVHDSAPYFFGNVDRITSPGYVPNSQDVLHSRARTTGIAEIQFFIDGVRFRMMDVGGQRSERKKWIHCFQDVTALIFCVAMSEYDLKLYEDDGVNRMQESMMLFEEICNCQWFLETAIILFLNKVDLFYEKITRVDLNVCFPEYTGGLDAKKGSQFLRDKFTSLNRGRKPIYAHLTCATDTDNVSYVFACLKDIILRHSLQRTI